MIECLRNNQPVVGQVHADHLIMNNSLANLFLSLNQGLGSAVQTLLIYPVTSSSLANTEQAWGQYMILSSAAYIYL